MSGTEEAKEVAVAGKRRRRRLWSEDEKRQIVGETFAPEASVSLVARRHDVNANMLFTWRREFGAVAPSSAGNGVTFVPAAVIAESVAVDSPPLPLTGRMEIALAGGDRVTVGVDVDAAALARVIKVLSRR